MKRIRVAGVVVLLVAALAACGLGQGKSAQDPETAAGGVVDLGAVDAGSLPADGSESATGEVVKDYAVGTLPTDPYRGVDHRLTDYAWDISVAMCMQELGYSYPVVSFDWNDPGNRREPSYARVRTPEEAAQYGFRLAPEEMNAELISAREYISQQGDDYSNALDGCSEGVQNNELFDTVTAVDLVFPGNVAANPAVVDANEAWHKCMEPLGVPDLPEEPGTAPSIMTRLGLDGVDNLALTDSASISEDEINMAVQEAECYETSGYDRLVYDLTWQGLDDYVQEHSAELAARADLIQQQTDALISYIEENRGRV
ncbi:hypothetical protein [Actinomyces qiguomingii]|uniref:hypothetical protein n=1 Tax=Actinomyces qiguomingii TaxID=2057800 RepID=UPI000FFF35A2|nr:hypothetical protein [Actinomyces qiguomingii]